MLRSAGAPTVLHVLTPPVTFLVLNFTMKLQWGQVLVLTVSQQLSALSLPVANNAWI